MNEKEKKELNDRFDKVCKNTICKSCISIIPKDCQSCGIIKWYLTIKDFIHSEIEKAEKEVLKKIVDNEPELVKHIHYEREAELIDFIRANKELADMVTDIPDKLKQAKIEGVRELIERIAKLDNAGYTFEKCNEGKSICIWEMKQALSEFEQEIK